MVKVLPTPKADVKCFWVTVTTVHTVRTTTAQSA